MGPSNLRYMYAFLIFYLWADVTELFMVISTLSIKVLTLSDMCISYALFTFN